MKRAERRHHRERTFTRRKKILLSHGFYHADMTRKVMHWHLNCGCWTCDADRHAERRRQERAWRRAEGV